MKCHDHEDRGQRSTTFSACATAVVSVRGKFQGRELGGGNPAFFMSDRCAGIPATTCGRDSRRRVRVFFAQRRASRQHDGSTIGAARATLGHGRTWRRTKLLAWTATGSEGFGLSFG